MVASESLRTLGRSVANEIYSYTELQRQIHEALRAQHPEWVEANGDSPICDSYEQRLSELLRLFRSAENHSRAA